MKNANRKGFDKDHKQSSSSQFKSQDKGKKDAREGFGHMKQEYPTYLKTIWKSKTLTATLSDTELEDDSNNEDNEILNAFVRLNLINHLVGFILCQIYL